MVLPYLDIIRNEEGGAGAGSRGRVADSRRRYYGHRLGVLNGYHLFNRAALPELASGALSPPSALLQPALVLRNQISWRLCLGFGRVGRKVNIVGIPSLYALLNVIAAFFILYHPFCLSLGG